MNVAILDRTPTTNDMNTTETYDVICRKGHTGKWYMILKSDNN